ncbi:DUF4450 domain-containing protein [Mesonia sp.]|nr:DUF4450 domain-containing protein [Mesonia sp.]|tara:strand:+ start:3826 stop:7413 length:3588 start_codon:yes stop_codon:yes gene_type:complete
MLLVLSVELVAQENYWHQEPREIHYQPNGNAFELVHGNRKFNRALYGTNTGFRVEAGDLPEFAMYMPGMGGNFQLGISSDKKSKWITEANHIKTSYIPGRMEYSIEDEILQGGKLHLQILALADDEGFILQVIPENIPAEVDLIWVYGGASGKKFHRDGDIGADPESVFYLQPDYCEHNDFEITKNTFQLDYAWDAKNKETRKMMTGVFPDAEVKLADVHQLENPLNLWNSTAEELPVLVGKINDLNAELYWEIGNELQIRNKSQKDLQQDFKKAFSKAEELANRVQLKTPDPYLNTLGGALATAADGIWEAPAYLHGSVAWRMHLNAWRGAYVADPLGWHDRAKTHFSSYANSQVLEPESGPVVPDTSRHFARQKEKIGTSMFSRGYISRHPNKNTVAHHYDMNLVFFDQLLKHFQWSGDVEYIKELWPTLKRHLAWEKRNFDTDGDGLYDAYAAIWASDALQYSGGGVVYTSAYNYSANKMAAKLASIIGENPQAYEEEAEKIKNAIQQELWIQEKGIFAEYKDLLGEQNLHEQPGIWSVYHTIDEGVPSEKQALQMLNYVSTEIPHIPVKAEGLDRDLSLISTTNWQPYTWSVNNVALAENLHMALAYWQGGNTEKAYDLWQSALIESMYLGASPGGFQQLSFYDAIRGELYRDFADPIGMAARSLVGGLFGIQPNALENELKITPGFPKEWKEASLQLPNIAIEFQQNGNSKFYKIQQDFSKELDLKMEVGITSEKIEEVLVNGKSIPITWKKVAYTSPKLIIEAPYAENYEVEIKQSGNDLENPELPSKIAAEETLHLKLNEAKIVGMDDPQKIIKNYNLKLGEFQLNSSLGNKSFFVKLQQGEQRWWKMIAMEIVPKLEVIEQQISGNQLQLSLRNNTSASIAGKVMLNSAKKSEKKIELKTNSVTEFKIPIAYVVSGTNHIQLDSKSETYDLDFQNWDIRTSTKSKFETIDLSSIFNSEVSDIFTDQYQEPRPLRPSLQLPTTGIGNWCYPWIAKEVHIDDSGLREKAGENQQLLTPQGIPFQTPSAEKQENIAFVSNWEVYPKQLAIPLYGKASHAYLMMAGSTNPMQSRFVNGEVIVTYQDDSTEILELKNPENWWPIEQDYYVDGYAFTTDAPKPPRVYLKTGEITREFDDYYNIHGYSNKGINGGAATILDLPLNPKKKLKSLIFKARANDIVIGLMSLSLKRK